MNTKTLLASLAGALALSLPAFTVAADAFPITGPAIPGFEAYDQIVPPLLEKWHVPGASIAIAYRGRIVFARGYGLADVEAGRPVQPDTRFRIGSDSKAITAAAILRLVDAGRLSLDDRAFAILGYPTPTYPGAARDPRLDQITIRQLLTHTAGWRASQAVVPLPGYGAGWDPMSTQREIAEFLGTPPPATAEQIVSGMVGQPLQATPGTVWEYSNLGFATLGLIVAQKTGLGYQEAVREMLATCGITGARTGGSRRSELAADEAVYYDYPGAPLARSNLDDELVPRPYMYSLTTWNGSGGWTMSPIDYVRFLLALEGRGGVPALLQPAMAGAMRIDQSGVGARYGFGWVSTYLPYGTDSGHAGGLPGTRALALRSSDGDWLRVAFFNSAPADNATFEGDIYRMLHAVETLPSAPEHDLTTSTLSWEAWQHARLGDVNAAPLDDPDADGIPNLLEYAAGLDPTRRDAEVPASFSTVAGGTPAVTYRSLILGHGPRIQVETSTDGVTWQTVTATPRRTALQADGTLSVTVNVPGAIQARVRVTQPDGGVSAVLALQPPATPSTRLVNLSTRVRAGRGDDTLVVGFVVSGDAPRTFLVRGVGPGLQPLGVPSFLVNPTLELFDSSGHSITANDQWTVNQAALVSVATDTGAFALTPGNADAGLLVTLKPGAYTAHVSSRSDQPAATALVEVYEADQGGSRLVNLSTRARIGSGSGEELIAGFVISGDQPRTLLLRAVGPGLRRFGIGDPVAAPQLQVMRGQTEIAHNQGWSTGDASEIARLKDAMNLTGAFQLDAGSTDAAMVITLSPGVYTMIVRPGAASSGVVLAEVYEVP